MEEIHGPNRRVGFKRTIRDYRLNPKNKLEVVTAIIEYTLPTFHHTFFNQEREEKESGFYPLNSRDLRNYIRRKWFSHIDDVKNKLK